MNVAVISSRSSYHHLSQLLLKDQNIKKIFHYGAPSIDINTIEDISRIKEDERYKPYPIDLSVEQNISDKDFDLIISDMKTKSIDLVLASGLDVAASDKFQDFLKQSHISPCFVYPGLTQLETNKKICRDLFSRLKIPSTKYEIRSVEYLLQNFYQIRLPFVLRLPKYSHGRQTIIITEENQNEVYNDLFESKDTKSHGCLNLKFDDTVWIEEYVEIKREFSYHMIVNKENWRFVGAARDYKKFQEDDKGFNTAGVGAYNYDNDEIDPKAHAYAAKLFWALQNHLSKSGRFYRGFMFLGMAETIDDELIILEINTRGGDPELNVLLQSLDNDISDLLYCMGNNESFPQIQFNKKKIVAVKLYNKYYDWNNPAKSVPYLKRCPDEIIHGVQNSNQLYCYSDMFSCSSDSRENAATKIFNYLDDQYLGQFIFRRDIGILD